MPDIGNLSDVQYSALDPYHVSVDNRPLASLFSKLELVNDATDTNTSELSAARGSWNTLGNRLDISLQDDGTFQPGSIDAALHNIALHEDGVDGGGISYIRMLYDERAKLSTISLDANFIQFRFTTGPYISTISTTSIICDNGTINIEPSSTVQWLLGGTTGNQTVQAHMNFPPELAHIHIYDENPTPYSIISPDYQTYVTGRGTFLDTSLKVYVNGVKISEADKGAYVYVPPYNGSGTWQLTAFSYVSGSSTNQFQFSRVLSANDRIRIDYDIAAS